MSDTFTSEELDNESLTTKGPATNYGVDYTLHTLAQFVEDGDIEVHPAFQRRAVWDKHKASRLIESFLLGYPVPNILLGRPENGDKLEVIDGQQRVLAISSYLAGKSTLTGDITPQYLKKSFNDLDEVDQRRLKNQVLKATILIYSVDQPDLKFSAFQRINTGSVVLTQQEIRNAIYGGSLNDFLHELNRDEQWRATVSLKRDSRMRDEETLLRFFAALFNRSEYQKPMTKFLNTFMEDHRNASQEELQIWRERFDSALKVIVDNYNGQYPFSLTPTSKQMSRAVFESIMVTVAELLDDGKTNFRDFTAKHKRLFKDEEYLESVTSHTSDDKRYKARFAKTMHYLK